MDHARAARSPVNRIDPADPGPPAEGAAVPGAATQAAPTPAAASRKPPSPARNPTRASLVKRLYRALDLKLTQLETLMAATARSDTADHERQSRAMDAIVRAFKRVTEVDPDILKSVSLPGLTAGAADRPAAHRTGKPGSGSAPASAVDAASAELLRRDIAGRLGALLAKRDVPGNPG